MLDDRPKDILRWSWRRAQSTIRTFFYLGLGAGAIAWFVILIRERRSTEFSCIGILSGLKAIPTVGLMIKYSCPRNSLLCDLLVWAISHRRRSMAPTTFLGRRFQLSRWCLPPVLSVSWECFLRRGVNDPGVVGFLVIGTALGIVCLILGLGLSLIRSSVSSYATSVSPTHPTSAAWKVFYARVAFAPCPESAVKRRPSSCSAWPQLRVLGLLSAISAGLFAEELRLMCVTPNQGIARSPVTCRS